MAITFLKEKRNVLAQGYFLLTIQLSKNFLVFRLNLKGFS